jgi:hypothetical protein
MRAGAARNRLTRGARVRYRGAPARSRVDPNAGAAYLSNVRRSRVSKCLGLAAALSLLLASCGGGDICLNCTAGTPTPVVSVSLTGSISRLSLFIPFDAVTVIVCLDLGPEQPATACNHFFLAPVDANGDFSRSRIDPGSEAIFFWVDQNEDGMIDPTDPIARLLDPEGELVDVSSGETVNVVNAAVDFTAQTATAEISITTTPTPTPTPIGTPTPTPTP